MGCERCKTHEKTYEVLSLHCKQLETGLDKVIAQHDALLKALRLYHDDGMDGALLMCVAETLRARADFWAYWGTLNKKPVPRIERFRHLADQLTEKHNAACAAIAKVESE